MEAKKVQDDCVSNENENNASAGASSSIGDAAPNDNSNVHDVQVNPGDDGMITNGARTTEELSAAKTLSELSCRQENETLSLYVVGMDCNEAILKQIMRHAPAKVNPQRIPNQSLRPRPCIYQEIFKRKGLNFASVRWKR